MPHTYRIRTHGMDRTGGIHEGKQVTFSSSSTDPDDELPLPELLAIHHACARVIHACGMSEMIEKWLDDIDGVRVLSEDGSFESAAILQTALQLAVYD
jgi:hypothetical protein